MVTLKQKFLLKICYLFIAVYSVITLGKNKIIEVKCGKIKLLKDNKKIMIFMVQIQTYITLSK